MQGPELEKLMEQLRSEFAASPPPTGAYKPKKGDMCAAKFTDGQWYVQSFELMSMFS